MATTTTVAAGVLASSLLPGLGLAATQEENSRKSQNEDTRPWGMRDDISLEQFFQGNVDAVSMLSERVREMSLTLGDTWRLNGWSIEGENDWQAREKFKELMVEDMQSIAKALELHVLQRSGKRWVHKNMTYACGSCCTCAVEVQPNA